MPLRYEKNERNRFQHKNYYKSSKIHIHSTKKRNYFCCNVPTTIVLFAIFVFLFCFYNEYFIYTQHIFKHITFLFAINMNKIYFNTNLQQKITKYHFLKKIEKTTVVVFLEVKCDRRHLF